MREFLKKHGSIIYVLIVTIAVAIVLVTSNELPAVVRALSGLRVRWIWASVAMILLYLLFRALAIYYYLRRQRCPISLYKASLVTGIGQFYSAVTPAASGGQPMQVIALVRMGVPLSIATASVSVKFIAFQFAFLLQGAVLWIANADMVTRQLYGVRFLVVIGFIVNSILVVAVVMTMVKSRLLDRLLGFCVRMGVRFRLIKDEVNGEKRARAMLEEYRLALSTLIAKPLDASVMLMLAMLQVFCLFCVIGCIYHAFMLHGFSGVELMTLQELLFITASFVPLPGAAGAQEGGFLLFFKNVFPADSTVAAMVCWRFMTYYLLMFLGLAAVVAESLMVIIRRRKEKKQHDLRTDHEREEPDDSDA